MNPERLQSLLKEVQAGELSIDAALRHLRRLPFENLPFATVDQHRALRCGHGEVIFCQGKTVAQVVEIAKALRARGHAVLGTRASEAQQAAIHQEFSDALIDPVARTILLDPPVIAENTDPPVGLICAGTADLPVADEAARTLQFMGVPTRRLTDVGVSGLHRLLAHVEMLQEACAVVVVAGMEGALPSVVGGLVSCPVFAVPTSVGYGANLGGVTALLGMLNSCAANICSVNIDNGFGGAYCAGLVYLQIARHCVRQL